MRAREYWNANLDTDNLSGDPARSSGNLEEALAFADSPDFRWARKRLGNARGRTIVDLGGGVGMHGILWARAGATVVVVDPAERRLAALRKIARRAGVVANMRFLVGGGEALPLAARSVDAVFTKSVLIHTDLAQAAVEMRRVLKPDGRGLFIEPLCRNPLIRLYRAILAPKQWRDITRYFDRKALAELGKPFGGYRLRPMYLCAAGAFFFQYGLRSLGLWRRAMRLAMRIDRALMRLAPALRAWCWFACIEVRPLGPRRRQLDCEASQSGRRDCDAP